MAPMFPYRGGAATLNGFSLSNPVRQGSSSPAPLPHLVVRPPQGRIDEGITEGTPTTAM